MTEFDPLAEAERLGTRLIAAVKEARTVMRDLRTLVTEAREMSRGLKGRVAELVDEKIGEDVAAGLEEYKTTMSAAIAKADDAIAKRFDELASIMLGEDKKSLRQGRPTLKQLIEQREKQS